MAVAGGSLMACMRLACLGLWGEFNVALFSVLCCLGEVGSWRLQISPSSTSPSSSSLQRNFVYDSSGSCPTESSSEEEDYDSGSDTCKEDEAHASNFFFSSPMSAKELDKGLVLLDNHAHHNKQGVTMAATATSVRGLRMHGVLPPLPLVVTASMANESFSYASYSKSKVREHVGSHSSSKVMVTAATVAKDSIEEKNVFLLCCLWKPPPKGKDVLSFSPSKEKESGGSKIVSYWFVEWAGQYRVAGLCRVFDFELLLCWLFFLLRVKVYFTVKSSFLVGCQGACVSTSLGFVSWHWLFLLTDSGLFIIGSFKGAWSSSMFVPGKLKSAKAAAFWPPGVCFLCFLAAGCWVLICILRAGLL
ncbi:hypothetical protein OIU85_017078 [Salix viminalis]|uniref:Uncharacterized protein n=1 Tax=Salix viminalis TaxID=40686 RepID=A0A9Q0V7C6_SALVM|nr:hypothetical protein OIU85_017078 [Salix viminalis]